MNPKLLGDLLGTSTNSIRRWSDTFSEFLSPSANPAKGDTRVYTKLDARILHYVALKRATHRRNDEIAAELEAFRAGDWQELPGLPEGWPDMDKEIAPWTLGAGTLAQISGLQIELQHAHEQRDKALERVSVLEAEIEALRASQRATQAELDAKAAELMEARAVVARVEGQMSQYTLGRAQPLNVGLIIVAALGAGAVLVLIAILVAALVI